MLTILTILFPLVLALTSAPTTTANPPAAAAANKCRCQTMDHKSW